MPVPSEFHLLDSPISPGLTVIEASAGTGKTYAISHLVPRLLLDGVLPDLSKLLLVTFTNDAARELADRVRRVLTRLASPAEAGESEQHPYIADLRSRLNDTAVRARLERALLDLDLLAVSTIHAFCQRTLQQEATLCGLAVMPEVITEDYEHLEPVVREVWIATLSTDPLVAALSTALDWQLEDALKAIQTIRNAPNPSFEPKVPTYPTVRGLVDTLCNTLKSDQVFSSLQAILQRIPAGGWNQGVANLADALARLQPFHSGDVTTLTYWQSFEPALELPGRIKARSTMGNALRTQVTNHPWFRALEELNQLTKRLKWAWQQHLAAESLPKLAVVMAQLRLITQDGLINALYHALHRAGAEGAEQSGRLAARLADRYHVALIDESQDTDARQLAIFRRIFLSPEHRRRLILVGDPKQAIYRFRGADPAVYLSARNSADARYTLTRTHRAPAALVNTLNEHFQRPSAFHHPDMAFSPAESALKYDRQLFRKGCPCSRLEAWIVPDTDTRPFSTHRRRVLALSERVASTIVDFLHHGELRTTYADGRPAEKRSVTPRDFAVLVATNAQADAMAAALQARSVPVVINSGSDVFASDEARELYLLLNAVLDPRRTRRLRRALATRMLGLDAAALRGLENLGPDGQQPALIWLERFTRWNHVWMTRGLAALLAELERPEIGVTRRLALVPLTGERRATNYRHLTDLLLEASRDEVPRPAETARWLSQQITRAEDRSETDERQLQLSSDREAVQVTTMHKAKGLEYPLVFCPYLAESLRQVKGLNPLPANGTSGEPDLFVSLELLDETLRLGRERQLNAANLEERLRLAYVALTRAQVRLWIFSFSGHPKSDLSSPLDWLLRSDAETLAHPSYSSDWATAARVNRGGRHQLALQTRGAERHCEDLDEHARAPLTTFREPPPATPTHYVPQADQIDHRPEIRALTPPPMPPSWRITSFSTLTKEKHAHGAPAPAEPNAGPPSVSAIAAPGALPSLFAGAPAGAAVGTAVHDWIETWNLSPLDHEALARHIKIARLPASREGQATWTESLGELFTSLRTIRLPGCGDAPLHTVCAEPHGSEWHFHLPLAGSLTVAALARCFAEHAEPAHRPYAAALAALSDERFQGLLQGFIDRLARQGSAWGVIDWKTNRLGPSLSDYDEPALLASAMQEHYLLQTHLYLVALRRYLRALGLVDHTIAGAWLVFLRAIAPGETRGVLHINPPAALLDALDALFAPGGALP